MFCPTCGTEIPNDSLFCLKCGRSMSVAPNVPTVTKGAGPTGRLLRLGLILFGGVAVVALTCMIYYLNEGKAASPDAAVLATAGSKLTSSTPRMRRTASLPRF